jgi:PAS domain S-box-containing protein
MFLLELYYVVTIPGTTITRSVADILLFAAIIFIVALLYDRKYTDAERALRKSEFKFEDMIETDSQCTWDIDLDKRFTRVSPSIEKILGYKPEEMVGKYFYDFFDHKDRDKLDEKTSCAFSEKRFIRDFSVRCLHRGGRSVWTSISGVPMLDEESELLGFRGVIQDISEIKNYEEKLEALHRHAVELSNAGTIDQVADSSLRVIERILGFSHVAFGVVAENLLKFIRDSGHGKVIALPLDGPGIAVRAVETGETQLVLDTREDEGYVSAHLEETPETLSELDVPIKVNDEVVAVINVESEEAGAFNIEDQKLLETLAQNVASAIAIIRQRERLMTSFRDLERSNRELDEYTYVVSHDLKAPLRSLQAFSHFLIKDYSEKLDETGRDYLDRIQSASKRMQRLIDDLLMLSRVGRKFTDAVDIDLNDLIDEIRQDFEIQLRERNGEILCDSLPTIEGQKVWIRQLFANLIDNGLKFNKSQNPTMWIAYEERWNEYVFSLKDNGIGIDEENHETIFKIFQRLHTQEEYPGTGAGLAICKKIVEYGGGRIWVESEPGTGSTFFFTYPKEVVRGAKLEAATEPDQSNFQAQVEPRAMLKQG